MNLKKNEWVLLVTIKCDIMSEWTYFTKLYLIQINIIVTI